MQQVTENRIKRQNDMVQNRLNQLFGSKIKKNNFNDNKILISTIKSNE